MYAREYIFIDVYILSPENTKKVDFSTFQLFNFSTFCLAPQKLTNLYPFNISPNPSSLTYLTPFIIIPHNCHIFSCFQSRRFTV